MRKTRPFGGSLVVILVLALVLLPSPQPSAWAWAGHRCNIATLDTAAAFLAFIGTAVSGNFAANAAAGYAFFRLWQNEKEVCSTFSN